MKEVILIIFHFIFLLAVRGNTYQCPDCLIPCVANSTLNISNSQLLQTFHHQIRDYTLLTFLDAINGDVRFMSSHGREVFFKTISVNDYTMSELCSIFSNPPRLLRTSPHPKIKFMFLRPCLLSNIDESGNFYLFERMSLLLREQRDINVQLRDVKSDVDILNSTIQDNMESVRTDISKLQGVELKCNLQYQNAQTDMDVLNSTITDNVESVRSEVRNIDVLHEKSEMRKKLEYAILSADVYGTSFKCVPSNYRLQFPMSSKGTQHCIVIYPNWMYFSLQQEMYFNVIQLYLWDGDSRVFTYTINISRDGDDWTSIVVNYEGKALDTHIMSQTYTARYIRIKGESTTDLYFVIHWLKLDLI